MQESLAVPWYEKKEKDSVEKKKMLQNKCNFLTCISRYLTIEACRSCCARSTEGMVTSEAA